MISLCYLELDGKIKEYAGKKDLIIINNLFTSFSY